ncbi:MAG: DNA repair protein RecN [Gemmatimonadetes bacterium]|nr:DNA repair protein RecN [Gemmatimonadota bacterium]
MLTELRIKNLAIIEQLTLPLAPGFNVLTGETGAGKSIIVGALGLLLGERASSDAVRTGAEKAVVEGDFEVGAHAGLRALLDERGLEAEDGMLLLKREVAANGRARAWVNGTTVTAAVLAELGRALVSVHGQHESQALLDEPSQRAILDAFAEAGAEVRAVEGAAHAVAEARRAIAELRARTAEAERRADWLRHVAHEIGEAKLAAGEDVRLDEEARRLEHADELRSLASGLSEALEGDEEATLTRLGGLQRSLASLIRIDPQLAPLQESLDGAWSGLAALEAQVAASEQALREAAARLTKRRTAAAARLAREVDAILPTLGLPDGRFAAALVALSEPGTHGAETVEFRVALNVGHEARPIARVASGGELSRVMLALKTILARLDHVPTLVFDEVDAGIGGKVGLQVGDAMRRVAAHHQVFAISHLPQLAARAHHHIRVQKGAKGGVTTADVTVLAGEDRVREVARMLGGDDESSVSQAHARELLAHASEAGPPPTTGRGATAEPGRHPRKR